MARSHVSHVYVNTVFILLSKHVMQVYVITRPVHTPMLLPMHMSGPGSYSGRNNNSGRDHDPLPHFSIWSIFVNVLRIAGGAGFPGDSPAEGHAVRREPKVLNVFWCACMVAAG